MAGKVIAALGVVVVSVLGFIVFTRYPEVIIQNNYFLIFASFHLLLAKANDTIV